MRFFFIDSERHEIASEMGKRKKKDAFKEFRSTEKSAFSTVKTTLKAVLRNREEIQPAITNIVFQMNDLIIHSYQFIRLYLLKCFNERQPFPEVNETFVLYCMKTLGKSSNRGRKSKDDNLLATLNQFYDTEYQPLLSHEKTDLTNKSFVLPYLARQMLTSIVNNIKERFLLHFLRFINKTTSNVSVDKKLIFELKRCLLEGDNQTNVIFDEWKTTHIHHIIPQRDVDKSVPYDVKVNPFDYLRGMMYMSSVLEREGHKLFQPLPLRTNIVPKSIVLDTPSIIDLFCPEGESKSELLKKAKENRYDVWNNVLNLQHKVFKKKNYEFRYQIQTDGVSCSILFIREDLKDKKWGSKLPTPQEQEFHLIEDLSLEQLEFVAHRNIVGCDPGKRSLVYMVDSNGKKLQYTAPQRRKESTSFRCQRILLKEKKKNNIIEKETRSASQNGKSIDYEKFKTYLVEKDRLNKETTEFYKKDVWRKMKFRRYSYSKKSMDKFLNKIKKTFGENILIGYGNWSRKTQMKHFMPTLGRGLRKEIHKKYDTITINEINTSKKCCDCQKDLSYYKSPRDRKQQYRLLVCSECVRPEVKQNVFRARDFNAAINIKNIAKHWIEKQERPECFKIQRTSSFTT